MKRTNFLLIFCAILSFCVITIFSNQNHVNSQTLNKKESVENLCCGNYLDGVLKTDRSQHAQSFSISNQADLFDRKTADALFRMIEFHYSERFSPEFQPTMEADQIFYRHYPNTNVMIGTFEGNLYFLDNHGVLYNLGDAHHWLHYLKAEALFNWLEVHFSEFLFPQIRPTMEADQIFYRHYPNTNVMIGTFEGNFYFLDNHGVLYNFGNVDYWLTCMNQNLFFTLTMEFEGAGIVTPSEGDHWYAKDTVVVLKAVPAIGWVFSKWIGEIEDPYSQETTITMNDHYSVKAVFISDPVNENPPASPASILEIYEFSDTFGTLVARYEAWNCLDLEGEWKGEDKIDFDFIDIYGTMSSEFKFNMPTRPESGPWNSQPFSFNMQGTIYYESGKFDIKCTYENVVYTIFEFEGELFMKSRWDAKPTVIVTDVDFSFVYSDTFFQISGDPSPIKFGPHSKCK